MKYHDEEWVFPYMMTLLYLNFLLKPFKQSKLNYLEQEKKISAAFDHFDYKKILAIQ
jgi:3-methyladenine DNA glycosylase Tag